MTTVNTLFPFYRMLTIFLSCLFFIPFGQAQNSVSGSWSPIYTTDVIPVAAANLPDGRILAWSAWDRTQFTNSPANRTYTTIFDPNNNNNTFSSTLVSDTNHDMFCPGIANGPNGEIIVTGGSNSPSTSIFSPTNKEWRIGQNMNVGRGYHSMCTLNDGRIFTIGGSWSGGIFNRKAEIWTNNTGWVNLDNVDSNNSIQQGTNDYQGLYREDNHAWIWAAPNGRVFHAGPGTDMHWIETNGAGRVIDAGRRGDDNYSMNGNTVMYDAGKILKSGGATAYQDTSTYLPGDYPASNRAYTIDISDGNNANVSPVGNLNESRVFHNSVVLPNGEVVITGGACKPRIFSDQCARLSTEIWNPNTRQFRRVANMRTPRTYHSVAILMQDGRVWVGGGGLCGNCDANHPDAEIFTPPYLYSNNSLATRPSISTAPATANYSSTIQVTTGGTVQEFVLMRLSSVTHSVNNEQRRIPLTANRSSGNNYQVNIPNKDWLPPGDYFLFAMNNGVPSVAKVIRIGGNTSTSGGENNIQEVANGTYYIESLPTGQHVAVPSASENDVRMVNQGTGNDQRWEIQHQGNNVYTVKNLRNNQYLNVQGAGCGNGTNLLTWFDPVPNNSRWIINKVGNEYFFRPVHCTTQAMDNGNGPNKSALTWVYSTGNNNQRFNLKPVGGTDNTPEENDSSETGDDAQEVANGTYYIESLPSGQHVASPSTVGNNVRMENQGTGNDQRWEIRHQGNNIYTVKNLRTNRYLNVEGWGCSNYTNILTWPDPAPNNSRWIINKDGNEYFFRPAYCSNHAMDNGYGTNQNVVLWQYSTNYGNQRFKLKPIGGTTPSEVSSNGRLQINGTYVIKSRVINQNVIAPIWNGHDARMYNDGTIYPDHRWIFQHLGGGRHRIQNVNSERYLAVAARQCGNGSNVITWPNINGSHFEWYVERVGSDYYLLPVHCPTQALDKSNGYSGNVLTWRYNRNNNNQKFDIISVDDGARPRSNILNDLRATPKLGQQTALRFYYHLPELDTKKIKAYTFQYFDEQKEDFVDLYTITASSLRHPDFADIAYTHATPKVGVNYYQVKIVFDDNTTDYSNYQLVEFEPPLAPITLAPNPAKTELHVDLSNYQEKTIRYLIINLQGQIMGSGKFEENHAKIEAIPLDELQNGNYFMYLRPDSGREITKKFLVMKDY